MPLFCLPDPQNPARADPKAEQNLQNLEKCSTAKAKLKPRWKKASTSRRTLLSRSHQSTRQHARTAFDKKRGSSPSSLPGKILMLNIT